MVHDCFTLFFRYFVLDYTMQQNKLHAVIVFLFVLKVIDKKKVNLFIYIVLKFIYKCPRSLANYDSINS